MLNLNQTPHRRAVGYGENQRGEFGSQEELDSESNTQDFAAERRGIQPLPMNKATRTIHRLQRTRDYQQHAQRREREHRYTYDDYAALTDGVRYEVIDGALFAMAAPLEVHQIILAKMLVQFDAFLEGKTCIVIPAAYDVRLFADPDSPDDGTYHPDDTTVVQPDLVVICDKRKRHPEGCRGAPDLVVEILSPSNSKHDTEVKYKIYQETGVREYWIVDPEAETVNRYNLKAGVYTGETFIGRVNIPSNVLPGCVLDMEKVFSYSKE
jgi:Uma2 family endonuclease